MTDIQPFVFPESGHPVRSLFRDSEPWFVAADVCGVLEHTNVTMALKGLDEDERHTLKRSRRSDTLNFPDLFADQRIQSVAIVSESGLYSLILRSKVQGAKRFKRWITHEVLPALRKQGSYSLRQPSNRELARMVIEEADRADAAEVRAESAEGTVRAIEGGDGLSLRMFHKKYLSDVPERVFFEHLYAHDYLIDQRGKGSEREDGTFRDGAQHRHPTYKGKPYFYFHFSGIHGDRRRESTRVRPGQPELDLKAVLAKEGLAANENTAGVLFALEGGAS